MIAYKVFNSELKCIDFQYAIGGHYYIAGLPVLCKKGFHACFSLIQCFDYYDFNPTNRVAIVDLIGDIVGEKGDKYCTNEIKIVRELSWHEVLDIVNTGSNNTGNQNSGNWNSGNQNSGNWNSGNQNSGNWNSGNQDSGNWNSGDRNSGDRNSGYWNSGNQNSGNRNSGNWNSGDRNSGDRNSGNFNLSNNNCGDFNSIPPKKIYFFNTLIPYKKFLEIKKSKAYAILKTFSLVKYRIRKKSGKYGDYKFLSYKSSFLYFWRNLSINERLEIIRMPYFNKQVFYDITGVKIN